jgi:hypothetical protein
MKKSLTCLTATIFLAGVVLAQNTTDSHLVCQGEYSALGKGVDGETKVIRLDHWHMESMQDGSYSVEVELATSIPGLSAEEQHLLGKDFKTKKFVSVISNGAGSGKRSIKIECEYGMAELSCHTTDNGSLAAARIQQKLPYTFWPTVEAPTFDFPWAFQAIASRAERVVGHKTAMPLITLDDGETENSISLKVQEIEEVEYLGREAVEVMGKELLAHKFRLVDPKNSDDQDGAQEFWMSDSGILLSMKRGGVKIILTQYQGPSLGS